jgi:proton-translocating NADH-quinone oxidoreductase chain N
MHVLSAFRNDFYGIFPELFLTLTTFCILLFGVFFSTSRSNGFPLLSANVSHLGLLSLVGTFLLTLHMPFSISICFCHAIIIDEFALFFKSIILISACAAILVSMEYVQKTMLNVFEYTILILFSTLSMLFMISSYDFVSMYLAIEMQSLCFYVLTASKRQSEFSTEAGLKYFVLGALSSGLLLFGASFIYGSTGITNFEDISKCLAGSSAFTDRNTMVHIGLVLISIGFLFKLTAAPFHFWAPDVYEGAPFSVTAFFAIAPKIAIIGVLIRLLLGSFYDFLFEWQTLLVLCSVASLLIGSFGAIAQKKIKRLIVFSSVGHVGYMLIGLSCGTLEGIHSVLFYVCIYVLMTVNVFAVLLSVQDNQSKPIKYIQDLGLLSQTQPLLAFTLSCTLFSMAGIPPLAGFCSKLYLFFAAISASFYGLALLGVLCSVVSCFYYLRMIKIMYFEQPSTYITIQSLDRMKATIIAITSFGIIFLFVFPTSLFLSTYLIAMSFAG